MEAPLRDTVGKYKLLVMYRGFERLLYPGVGGNEGGLVYNNLAPQGKTGDFLERNEVDWIYRRLVQKITGLALSLWWTTSIKETLHCTHKEHLNQQEHCRIDSLFWVLSFLQCIFSSWHCLCNFFIYLYWFNE